MFVERFYFSKRMSVKESDPDFGFQGIVVLGEHLIHTVVEWLPTYLELVSCNFTTYPSSTLDDHQRMKGVFQYRKIVKAIAQ